MVLFDLGGVFLVLFRMVVCGFFVVGVFCGFGFFCEENSSE